MKDLKSQLEKTNNSDEKNIKLDLMYKKENKNLQKLIKYDELENRIAYLEKFIGVEKQRQNVIILNQFKFITKNFLIF